MTHEELCAAQVKWYRLHGKYSARITRDNTGVEYVIGDWSWLRNHGQGAERIEPQMEADLLREYGKDAP